MMSAFFVLSTSWALGPASYGLGLLAGVLSTLSPCVLPLLPILVGSAASAHRQGPWMLAAGLALSYALVGTLLVTLGHSLGLAPNLVRVLGASVMGLLGLVLVSTALQHRFAVASASIGNLGHQLMSQLKLDGLWGQFDIGCLLGLVWSPCVGPTLGAAVALAAQGEHTAEVMSLMLVFGLGTALPLLAVSQAVQRVNRQGMGQLLQAGQRGKWLLGLMMIVLSALVLSGLDKALEAWLLDHYPDWLTRAISRY